MVACDQPFTEVENPEFIAAMGYGRTSSKFTLPKKDGICRQVMKLGKEIVEEMKAMFEVRSSLLSTSPFFNIYSFVGLRRKNKSLSRCLDIKQLLCIFGNCGSLYHEWGAMRWAFKQCSYIFGSSFLQKSYLSISKSCWENIRARTWLQSSGQHWRHTASKKKFINLIFIPLDFVYWPVVRLWLLWWIMQVTTIHWWKH